MAELSKTLERRDTGEPHDIVRIQIIAILYSRGEYS